jgi:hypothetical protein
MFADDQQLYLRTTISSAAAAKGSLLACINDVPSMMYACGAER